MLTTSSLAALQTIEPIETIQLDITPRIGVGDPNGTPAASLSSRVDPNQSSSPFSGVVSIESVFEVEIGDQTLEYPFTCTGTLISPLHVVSAAHCFDFTGGKRSLDPETNQHPITGDGEIDFEPSQITVFVNHDNPESNQAGATSISVLEVTIHDDWYGFLNTEASDNRTSLQDDVAILELSTPAPRTAAIYPIVDTPIEGSTHIVLAGYGTVGDVDTDYVKDSADLFVKHTGENIANNYARDDEGGAHYEEFRFDFDGPIGTRDRLGDGPTLGNDIEVTVGGGDSGGPSFVWSDADGNQAIDKGELALVGINTYSQEELKFGAIGGGMIASAYMDYVEEQVDVNQPLLTAQAEVSGDLEASWIAGTDITETWVFTTPTGGWSNVVGKYKTYGGKDNLTIPGLEDGTYYLASRGWWVEDGQWHRTSLTKTRVPYVVKGPSQQPQLQPQTQVDGDLTITWTEGTATTETWLFPTETGGWDQVVRKQTTYGDAKSLTLSGLEEGTYYAASRGWWVEDGVWKSTGFTQERVPYVVRGPSQQPQLQPQGPIGEDLEISWTEGTATTETWLFSTPTGGWDQVVHKQTTYGDAKNLTVSGLQPGTYYVASRGWWVEDGSWKSTSFSSERVAYTVDSVEPIAQNLETIGSVFADEAAISDKETEDNIAQLAAAWFTQTDQPQHDDAGGDNAEVESKDRLRTLSTPQTKANRAIAFARASHLRETEFSDFAESQRDDTDDSKQELTALFDALRTVKRTDGCD